MKARRPGIAGLLMPAVILVLVQTTAADAARQKAPTITVTVLNKTYYGEGHFPSDTYHTLICTWKATDADSVAIIGTAYENEKAEGTVELPAGNYIFVASGPGGVAFMPVGVEVTSRKGTGLDGQIYSFKEQFNPDIFSQFSYKSEVAVKAGANPRAVIIRHLQALGYPAAEADAPAQIPNGTFVYTPGYNPHPSLNQTPEDLARNGELKRQAALIVMLRPRGNTHDLYVLGVVLKNRPRQDRKWSFDPSGFQLVLPLCKTVADSIASEISR